MGSQDFCSVVPYHVLSNMKQSKWWEGVEYSLFPGASEGVWASQANHQLSHNLVFPVVFSEQKLLT